MRQVGLYCAAFVVGAIVMGFEMLGARYLNPYLGSGIYTWAALISTVLAALAAGYFAGGWTADRHPSLIVLGGTVVAGAGYLVALPLFADVLLEAIAARVENIKTASMLAAFLLMFWPVALLGMFSPFAIRLMLSSTADSGTVSGAVYGVSTVGSIVGTVGTTFVLIPEFGTRAITVGLGIAGIACGMGLIAWGALARRTGAQSSLLVACGLAAAALAFGTPVAAQPLDAAVVAQVLKRPNGPLDQIETEYNNIFINKRGTLMAMSFRRYGRDYTESVSDLANPGALPIPYAQAMTIGLCYPDRVQDVLLLGVGGGSLGVYLKHHLPDVRVDMVDLDPGVIAAAKTFFALKEAPDFKFIAADGRIHLVRQAKAYDLVLVDAFRGGYVPFHLLTTEFYEILKRRLGARGVAVFNIHAGTELFQSTLKTLQGVFPTVHFYDSGAGSIIAVATAEREVAAGTLLAKAEALQAQARLPYPLPALLRTRIALEPARSAKVLTDDFAPAAMFDTIIKNNERRW